MANHSLYRGCYMVTIHWVNESDWVRHISAVGVDTPLNDATNYPHTGRSEYSWIKDKGSFLNEKNSRLAIRVAEGRWRLPCLEGGEVGRHFCILQQQCLLSILQSFKGSEGKLTMKGRRTNTGCDSWTLPVGTLGDPRTPESKANVGRMQRIQKSSSGDGIW